jgi:hypothetical protein
MEYKYHFAFSNRSKKEKHSWCDCRARTIPFSSPAVQTSRNASLKCIGNPCVTQTIRAFDTNSLRRCEEVSEDRDWRYDLHLLLLAKKKVPHPCSRRPAGIYEDHNPHEKVKITNSRTVFINSLITGKSYASCAKRLTRTATKYNSRVKAAACKLQQRLPDLQMVL